MHHFFFEFVYNSINKNKILNKPFPHRKINGTPSQRSLCTWSTAQANVGVTESFGTVESSRYPVLASSATKSINYFNS